MNGEYQIVGTTEGGEQVVFGFGYNEESAHKRADEMSIERPINTFTKLPYTYTVVKGGDPRVSARSA